MNDYIAEIKKYIELEINTLKNLDYQSINRVIQVLEDARKRGATIYVCGNGGSAATASHLVCDFNKGISLNQELKYKVISLNDNIPTMMAIANDIGYDRIFDIPLRGRLKKTDLLLAISGSGNSLNVVNAVKYAVEIGTKVIGITGYDGGEVKKLSNYFLHVPVDDMQISEDVHMIFDHMIMHILCPSL